MMLLHTAKGVEAWILNFKGYYIALVSMAVLYKQDKIDLSVWKSRSPSLKCLDFPYVNVLVHVKTIKSIFFLFWLNK